MTSIQFVFIIIINSRFCFDFNLTVIRLVIFKYDTDIFGHRKYFRNGNV